LITSSRRTIVALGGLVAVLATYDVVRHALIPSRSNTWANVAMIGAIALVAVAAGLGAAELGLTRAALPAGLRWGLGALALVTVVLAIAAAVPAWRGLFDDGRTDVSAPAMVWRALVVIPVGTVVFEELAFRGVLLGLLRRLAADRLAVAVSAVLFGLWHVPGVWDDGVGAVAGTVVATTAAGVVFAWLRLRSASLVAPVLAHVATNSVAFVLAWWIAR
jgi:membrane protease YdiL (CAAX protease family)